MADFSQWVVEKESKEQRAKFKEQRTIKKEQSINLKS